MVWAAWTSRARQKHCDQTLLTTWVSTNEYQPSRGAVALSGLLVATCLEGRQSNLFCCEGQYVGVISRRWFFYHGDNWSSQEPRRMRRQTILNGFFEENKNAYLRKKQRKFYQQCNYEDVIFRTNIQLTFMIQNCLNISHQIYLSQANYIECQIATWGSISQAKRRVGSRPAPC